MVDVTLVGGGSALRTCGAVLELAGFNLRRAFDLDDSDASPVILGESPSAQAIVTRALKSGRHLLIVNPKVFGIDRLAQLYEERRRSQALFLWSTRRRHPGYQFIRDLGESDQNWRPRYIRQDVLCLEESSSMASRWLLAESVALASNLAGREPQSVSASVVMNQRRRAIEHITMDISLDGVKAFLQLGTCEPFERRETVVGAGDRKAYVDELDSIVPVRLINKDTVAARRVACPSPSEAELARRQCLAFLEATGQHSLARAEARVWTTAFAAVEAAEASLHQRSVEVPVHEIAAASDLRLLPRQRLSVVPPSIA